MKVRNKIRSVFLTVLLSKRSRRLRRSYFEMRRRLGREGHVVSAFLQLDDPYSYLLARYLPELAATYDIELRVYLSQARGDAYQPAPDMAAEYAAMDAQRVARELGIPFLDKGAAPPVEYRRGLLDVLAGRVERDDFAEELFAVMEIYWRGDTEAAARRSDTGESGQADAVITASQQLQERLGHYNSGMLYYGGEWYWGVDRLHYLADRLDEMGLARDAATGVHLASV